jgi:hypothetical protein
MELNHPRSWPRKGVQQGGTSSKPTSTEPRVGTVEGHRDGLADPAADRALSESGYPDHLQPQCPLEKIVEHHRFALKMGIGGKWVSKPTPVGLFSSP